jgi:hypothetical protein
MVDIRQIRSGTSDGRQFSLQVGNDRLGIDLGGFCRIILRRYDRS